MLTGACDGVGGEEPLRHGLIVFTNGDKAWYVHGKRHRDDGLPAIEYANGDRAWYVLGRIHRGDGLPAIDIRGVKEWWVNGVLTTAWQCSLRRAWLLACVAERG